MNNCIVKDCSSKVLARGLCGRHYKKWSGGDNSINPLQSSFGRTKRWIEDHKNYNGNDCIVWPFARNKRGYGNIYFKGVYTVASRVMCIKAHGEPESKLMEAAHSCGNGVEGCMNPKHLSWKTHTENENDKNKHKTRYRGSDCSFSKYDWPLIRSIRADSKEMRNKDIAEKYNITRQMVSNITLNKSWKKEHDPEYTGV